MYQSKIKRIIDVVLSSVSLIILSPIFLIIMALIKLFDPGPIFFTQKRIGKSGDIFKFYKFRSMRVGTKEISSCKINNLDISFIGKLIRRTNLDELPQLFNIIKGDMSLVGPRPSLLSQVELIGLRKSNNSLSCLPGLTGLAQVNSYDAMSYQKKAYYDGLYYKKISFILDIVIILKTFKYLLSPPPKY